jgi:hypothetical protein
MTSLKGLFVFLALVASLVACGESGKDNGAPGGGSRAGKPAVGKAADDVPSSNKTGIWVGHLRFGADTDGEGVVVQEMCSLGRAPPAMSFHPQRPAGTQMRLVWNDLAKNAALGEEVAHGDKGFVTFSRAAARGELPRDDVLAGKPRTSRGRTRQRTQGRQQELT